ncbi:MAG: hypothetical protein H6706_27685 [Myxococcales bacterium]|nr:hypothetical protein [Myxococcales bacterium]
MALPDDRRIDVSRFPQQIQRFLSDEAPTQARLIVARGTLPMPPVVQACALYQLQVTSDDEVRLAALETMKRMAPAAVRQVAGEALPPVVLDWIAEVFQAQQPIVRTVLLNANTDGDTFVRLARLGDEATTETIALNQARLLSTPGLIQALYLNRNTRASTADRIVDFGVRNQVDLRDLPCYDEIVAAIQGSAPATAEQAAAADAAFREMAAKAAAEDGAPEEEIPEDVPVDEDEAAADDEEPEKAISRSAAGRIADLNIAQRVRLAMLGSRADRAVLIKDSNKIVTRAVIRSPAVTDAEAMMYAALKSLPEEIVGYIAHNKKWTRHYQMKKLLVYNPKTPVGDAMRFLAFLRAGDLKSVARSRAIPGPVSKAASQMMKSRLR